MQELKAISLLSWCSSGIHPYLARINAPARVCDVAGAEPAVVRAAQNMLFEKFTVADNRLAGREFFFDHFTAPDAHFFWCYRRGTQFNLDLAQFKHCTAHFERMKQRPSVQKLLAFEQQVQSDFAKVA
jgi:glutathione S-transferase